MGGVSEMADFLKSVQLAMRLEGIPEESVEHVIDRLVYGDPHGPVRHRDSEPSEQIQVHVTVTAPGSMPEFAQRVRAMSQQVQRGRLG